MKYYLDLREKRLKDHGLTLELDIQPQQDVMPVHRISNNIQIVGNGFFRFNKSLYIQYITRTVTFSWEGKRLLHRKKYLTMYQTILDLDPEDENLGSTTFVCPDCGSISTIEVFQDTCCPYYGTRHLMKDLYPKVTNYYYIDNGSRTAGKWNADKSGF